MKTKTTVFLTAVMFLASVNIYGQETTNQNAENKEIGLRFSGLNNFDIIYKVQKAENKYLRLRLARASVSYSTTDFGSSFNSNLGLAIGKEMRKPLADKLYFVHGAEFITFLGYSNNGIGILNFKPGVGVVLGVQYDISEKFYANVETIPAFMLEFESRGSTDGILDKFGAELGFANTAAITLAYRF